MANLGYTEPGDPNKWLKSTTEDGAEVQHVVVASQPAGTAHLAAGATVAVGTLALPTLMVVPPATQPVSVGTIQALVQPTLAVVPPASQHVAVGTLFVVGSQAATQPVSVGTVHAQIQPTVAVVPPASQHVAVGTLHAVIDTEPTVAIGALPTVMAHTRATQPVSLPTAFVAGSISVGHVPTVHVVGSQAATQPVSVGTVHAEVSATRSIAALPTVYAQPASRTLTERMIAKAPELSHRLWLDTGASNNLGPGVLIAEAPSGCATNVASYRGVFLPDAAGEVVEREGFAWASRGAGW